MRDVARTRYRIEEVVVGSESRDSRFTVHVQAFHLSSLGVRSEPSLELVTSA
jgi:hypothetical protein